MSKDLKILSFQTRLIETKYHNQSVRTEFDDLPRIKNTDIDATIQDENPVKKSSSKRVWDKNKKNFVWQRDEEDKMSKE